MHGTRHKESEAAREGRARGTQGTSEKCFKPNRRRARATMETPIEWLNEDYAKLQKDSKALMSEQSLLYLKYRKLISAGQVEMYQAAAGNPETRMIVSFYNTVTDINEKLVYMLDNA